MMNPDKLLEAAQATSESKISLLIEGGAYDENIFAQLHEQCTARMYSLYQHPQLLEARMAGPWLLEVNGPQALANGLNMFPLTAGAIFHSTSARSLAVQLSWGCTPLNPEKQCVLSRFYIREVLEPLAQRAETEWHSFLFQGIQQWWMPDQHDWTQIAIPPSTAKGALDHAVRLDEETWAQIYDRPEVTSVLTQWQTFPSAQAFPPCSQRNMTTKALDKAQAAGMGTSADRKLYALVYLNGGKPLLESTTVQEALIDVKQGKRKLMDVLLAAEQG
ncbi:MAG TPA: DUF4123 domain-containing protein [Buttiauxella sp.]|jgi:hypothetical protein